MKKVAAVLAVVFLVVSLFSLAFAGGEKKVVVKSVDVKAMTMTVTEDGKDSTMGVDKAVDLSKVKPGDKVNITVDKDMITGMKAAKSKAAVGC